MKKLVGLVVILAAVILGSYYGMGMATERALKNNIAMMNQSNGLTIDMEQYKRGLYRSKAILNVSMQVPARTLTNQAGVATTLPAQDYKILMPIFIYHGPVIFAASKPMFGLGYARSEVALPQPYADQLNQAFTATPTAPVLNLSAFVSYLNNSTLSMDLPTFKLVSKEGNTQYEWLGMASDINVSSSRDAVEGRVAIDGMKMQKDKLSVVLGKVDSDYKLHQTPFNLYLGDASLSLDTLMVTDGDKKILDVQQFTAHSMSNIKDGLFSSHAVLTLSKLWSNDKTYGPARLDISIKNLDAEILANINEQANNLQQGTEAERQQAMIQLVPQLPKLFSKGPTLEVSELSMTMPEGVIKGNLLISLPATDSANPFQLIQKTQGQGRFVYAEAVMKQLLNDSAKQQLQKQVAAAAVVQANATTVPVTTAPDSKTQTAPVSETVVVASIDNQAITQLADEKLAAMIQSGLLIKQGSDYVTEFKLESGQLTVNGKPFSPAMMKF